MELFWSLWEGASGVSALSFIYPLTLHIVQQVLVVLMVTLAH